MLKLLQVMLGKPWRPQCYGPEVQWRRSEWMKWVALAMKLLSKIQQVTMRD